MDKLHLALNEAFYGSLEKSSDSTHPMAMPWTDLNSTANKIMLTNMKSRAASSRTIWWNNGFLDTWPKCVRKRSKGALWNVIKETINWLQLLSRVCCTIVFPYWMCGNNFLHGNVDGGLDNHGRIHVFINIEMFLWHFHCRVCKHTGKQGNHSKLTIVHMHAWGESRVIN